MRTNPTSQRPPMPTGRRRGVVVYLGNRTGLVRDYESGKQVLYRRDESDTASDGQEVVYDVVTDDRNGQKVAINVTPIL